MAKFITWVKAARAETLTVSVSPVVIGSIIAYADGGFNWFFAAICLSFAILVHLMTNFTNDYYDFKKWS